VALEPRLKEGILLLISLVIISVLGIISAYIWTQVITRHYNFFEFCRYHLRCIESSFVELGIPLRYFGGEAEVFHQGKFFCAAMLEEESIPDNHERNKCDFPYDFKKVKGGLMNKEKSIVRVLVGLWAVCFFAAICYLVYYFIKDTGMLEFFKLVLQIFIGTFLGSLVGVLLALRIRHIGPWRRKKE